MTETHNLFSSIKTYKDMSTHNSQPRPLIIKEINLAREINFLQTAAIWIQIPVFVKQSEKSMEMVFKKEYLKLTRGVIKFKTKFFFNLHCCRLQKACAIGRINRAVIGYCFKVGVSFGLSVRSNWLICGLVPRSLYVMKKLCIQMASRSN